MFQGTVPAILWRIQQPRQCSYNVKWSATVQTLLQWKAIRITYFECVFVASSN